MSVCHLPPLLDCQPRDGGGCWDCSVPGAHAWHSDTRQALTPNCSSLRPAATVLNTPATCRLRPSRAGAAAAPRSSPCQGPSQRLLSSHQVLSQHLTDPPPTPQRTRARLRGHQGLAPNQLTGQMQESFTNPALPGFGTCHSASLYWGLPSAQPRSGPRGAAATRQALPSLCLLSRGTDSAKPNTIGKG